MERRLAAIMAADVVGWDSVTPRSANGREADAEAEAQPRLCLFVAISGHHTLDSSRWDSARRSALNGTIVTRLSWSGFALSGVSLPGQGGPFSHGLAQIGAPSRVRFPRAGNVKPLVQKEVVERTERRQHVDSRSDIAPRSSRSAGRPFRRSEGA